MATEKMYDKLAELVVKKGVNVRPGQPVIINSPVRDASFAKKVARCAYEAGAQYVSVEWRDTELNKMMYQYASTEVLSTVPQWQYDKTKFQHDGGACYISIVSDGPGAMAGVDIEKMNTANMAWYTKMADLMNYTMNNEGQWCVVGVPSAAWAKAVFPDVSEDEAYRRLEDAIFATVRVAEDNDPVAEWEVHARSLETHAEKLNAYSFRKLHFSSSLGTDLYVGLVKDHIWVGGGAQTPRGDYFIPNMPTEECFCMPVRTETDGMVFASKPLDYNGVTIRGFWMRFEKGKATEFGADEGQDALAQLLNFDEGSSRLGEVALVPFDSPVSRSGILFLNTLYDENAACHLALGKPYPENLEGGKEMTPEELEKHGANDSMTHVDFMIGTEDMNIDGITEDGEVIPVFRNGNFVF